MTDPKRLVAEAAQARRASPNSDAPRCRHCGSTNVVGRINGNDCSLEWNPADGWIPTDGPELIECRDCGEASYNGEPSIYPDGGRSDPARQYWPAAPECREAVRRQVRDYVRGYICAMMADPAERDALAQYAGAVLREAVQEIEGATEAAE